MIAAIHGYAIGAGVEFVLGCDLILAAENTVFSFPEAGLGSSVTGAASRLLPLIVGPLHAKELMLLDEQIDAAQAKDLGLVNAVVPTDKLTEHAMVWPDQLKEKPPATLALAKQALDQGIDNELEVVLQLEVSHALITEYAPASVCSAERSNPGSN